MFSYISQRGSVLFSRALIVWMLLLHRDVTADLFPAWKSEFLNVFWNLNDHKCRSWRCVGWCFLFFSLSVQLSSLQFSTLRVCVYCTCVSVCVGVHMCPCGGVFGAMGTDIWQRSHAQKKKVRPKEEEKLYSLCSTIRVSVSEQQCWFSFGEFLFYLAWTFTTAGSRTSAAGPAVYYLEMSHDLLSSWKMNGLFTFSRPSHISQVQRFCRCSMTESKLQITGSSTNIGDQSLEARTVYFHPGQRWTDRVNQRTEAEVTN